MFCEADRLEQAIGNALLSNAKLAENALMNYAEVIKTRCLSTHENRLTSTYASLSL